MITIREGKCNKLSGLSSLFISFDKNFKEVSSYIKLMSDIYVYDKNSTIWEIPVKGCHNLIDELSEIDDIELFTLPNEPPSIPEELDISKFKTPPFPYQVDAIKYGLSHDKWLLLDDMGLGKTLTSMYLAQELHDRGLLEHCFIIVGVNSLKSNWKKEIEKHSNLSAMILGEKIGKRGGISYMTTKEKAEQLKNKIDEFFIITNIESIRAKKTDKVNAMVEAFNHSQNKIDMIIVDEIHRVKDIRSSQGQALLEFDAKYKLGMTGTLVVNEAMDCYAPLVFIDRQKKGTATRFHDYYYISNDAKIVIGTKNLDVLKELINDCSLRRTKDLVKDQLPDKTIVDVVLDMEDKQATFYKEIEQGIVNQVDLVKLKKTNLLAMVTRLRQATACPQVLSSNNIGSIKIDRCIEIVDDLVSQNEKVVIFSTFKDTVKDLENKLSKYNPLIITGDTSDINTSKFIDEFQQKDERKVLIATTQKLGTGHTLHAARYMIFIDCPWTSASYSQACDRIHRVGQKRPVFIYNLICKDTIDERVSEIIDSKEALSQEIVDGKEVQGLEKLREYIQNIH